MVERNNQARIVIPSFKGMFRIIYEIEDDAPVLAVLKVLYSCNIYRFSGVCQIDKATIFVDDSSLFVVKQ